MPDNFDWTKLLDVTGLVDTESTPPASVSFMITKAQKDRLREIGYSDDLISTMTPEEAHRLINLNGSSTPRSGL